MQRPPIASTCVTWLALVLSLVALSRSAPATRDQGDPARVEGQWNYRTQSNCGSVVGVGSVSFAWDAESGTYEERGQVHWSDSGSTIRWWGTDRYDSQARRLYGRMHNSLGDDVDGHWQLEGPGPDRLVVRWTQTNGCYGEGIATRVAAPRR